MLNPQTRLTYGSDPEGFFQAGHEIVGSELYIPEQGLRHGNTNVVRDGVQFEIHPSPGYDVVTVARNVRVGFNAINEMLRQNPGVTLCFDGLVTVSREQLARLRPESQVLGCTPSKNIYGERPLRVNGVTYRKRSSGGHIHLGLYPPIYQDWSDMDHRSYLVFLMDRLVGNTCVMLDRDTGAVERRRNYGRAGEYRDPRHGVEYRTLSNFWLLGYPLMSLAFGMANMAVAALTASLNGEADPARQIANTVNTRAVRKAIDKNDFDLALNNFQQLRGFLEGNLPKRGFPLTSLNLDKFIEFARAVNRDGLERFFSKNSVVDRWLNEDFVEFADWLDTVRL